MTAALNRSRLADDPVREVAAVGAARDAEAVGVGQPVRDRLVHPGHHVGHRPVAPVAQVGPVEGLAVALRAARVGGQDGDPGPREDLPLEHRGPAVERVRSAVDLEHQRPGAGTAGEQPALDLESVALPAALHGLHEGQLRGELVVEAGDGARRACRAPRRDVEDDDLGEGRGGRADRGHDVALALRGRAGVPAGEVVAVRREALGLAATGDRHAPQLHRAVDRGREQDVRPVRGGRDGRLAADRHVAVHRGIRLELAAGEEVRAATGARHRSRPRRSARCPSGSRTAGSGRPGRGSRCRHGSRRGS